MDPKNEGSNYGCINFPEAINHMDEGIADAQQQGAMVTCGGFANTDDNGMGRFYEPTILANVHEGMRIQMN